MFALSATAVFAAVSEDVPAAKDPERVLARIESHEIKEKDIDQLLLVAGPQAAMMYDNEQGRKMILEELVAARLFALSARKQGFDDTPEYKADLDNFVTQALARMAVDKAIKDVTATDEDCKKFYDENQDQFATPE